MIPVNLLVDNNDGFLIYIGDVRMNVPCNFCHCAGRDR